MWIEKLALEGFRNYDSAALELDPGLNLVVGRNAQGKTNLLEAVHCLGGLGSPRSPDSALVKDGAERAVLHAEVVRETRHVRVDLEFRHGRGMRALLNGTPIARGKVLSELVVTVFFGPDELSLVKGSPDGRRRFLDELVVKLRPVRQDLRREWERTLKQRNALLRSPSRRAEPRASLAGLEVWDEALCRTGAALTVARLEALASLAPHVTKRYEEIAGGGRLELDYEASWMREGYARAALLEPAILDVQEVAAMLKEAIEVHRTRELERGLSLVGPHRDDVMVKLASAGMAGAPLLEARGFASQGDQRTSALALKLAEHDLLTQVRDEHPILLLDDVFSELDPQRREWLADAVRGLGQTLVSSAEPGSLEAAKAQRVIAVSGGELRVEEERSG